jgi:hypothetical protein
VNGFIPTLAALLLAIVPLELPTQSKVDAVELNHFYDQDGRHVFDQAICWRFNRATCRHEVQAWWLVKDESASGDMLRFDGSVMRRVTTGRFFESWTQYDRELFDRQQVPQEERRNVSPCWKQVRRVLEER